VGPGQAGPPPPAGGADTSPLSVGEFRLGCFVPQGWRHDFPEEVPPGARWGAMVDFALRAERSGYGAVWVYDHLQAARPGPAGDTFDSLLSLATLGWATTKIRLGAMCLALPLHHPAQLAHQLACLDVLSGGRLEVALGAGSDRDFASGSWPAARRLSSLGSVGARSWPISRVVTPWSPGPASIPSLSSSPALRSGSWGEGSG
jgi:hypothetical protein